MDYVHEYFGWFVGAGLLALLLAHPMIIPSLVGGIAALWTKVLELGKTG